MTTLASSEINTRVYNKSGADLYLGFLPPHGRTVKGTAVHAPATDFIDIPGDLRAQVALNPRALAAFKAALEDGKIELGFTPALVLEDAGAAGTSKVLQYDSTHTAATTLVEVEPVTWA
jgi:hypothetical protein